MSGFEHDPQIIEHAESLLAFQSNNLSVVLHMLHDEVFQVAMHYYGSVNHVAIEASDPYVDIRADKLVIEYFTQKHRNAISLNEALSSAREAVLPSENMAEAINKDLELWDAVEKELRVEHKSQTVQLGGMPQRISLAGIIMVSEAGSS